MKKKTRKAEANDGQDRRRLVAALEDPVSVGRLSHPEWETRHEALLALARAVVPCGKEAVVRFALAAARAALGPWQSAVAAGRVRAEAAPCPAAALAAAEAWLACPCVEHEQHARQVGEAVMAAIHGSRALGPRLEDPNRALGACADVVTFVAAYPDGARFAREADDALVQIEHVVSESIGTGLDVDDVWRTVRAEVVPWAHGS